MTRSGFLDVVIIVLSVIVLFLAGFNAGYKKGKSTGMIRGATIAIQEIDRTVWKSLDKLIERLEKELK